MADYGPSTSGRCLDSNQISPRCLSPRQGSYLSRVAPLLRSSRRTSTECRAVALPGGLRLFKSIYGLIRPEQSSHAEQLLVEVEPEESSTHEERASPVEKLVKQATAAALHVGLRLTAVAISLARLLIGDVNRKARWLRARQQVKQQAAAVTKQFSSELQRKFEVDRERLKLRGRDLPFMQMLHVLDRSSMDLEAKWALVQKHTADKADFSVQLEHLFRKARDSKEAVETLLRPGASRLEINSFWKSEQTAALIAEEEALKQLVFAQMLQGT